MLCMWRHVRAKLGSEVYEGRVLCAAEAVDSCPEAQSAVQERHLPAREYPEFVMNPSIANSLRGKMFRP